MSQIKHYAELLSHQTPTGDKYKDILTIEEYQEITSTGMAWEFYPDLELSWSEFKKNQEEYFYKLREFASECE